MELFDFIDCLFDKRKWVTVTGADKKKHYFMTIRFLSIKYPIEANKHNKLNVNYVAVLDFWHTWLSARLSTKPSWMFTKTIKNKDKQQKDKTTKKIDKLKSDTIKYYLKMQEMDMRDFEFRKEIDPEGLFQELKMIDEFIAG